MVIPIRGRLVKQASVEAKFGRLNGYDDDDDELS